mgnify:CR=1 FL=1
MLKIIKTIFLVISLTSCSTISSNKIAPGYAQAYDEIKKFLFGFESNLDSDYIESIPYASMIVKIGNGPSGLMILQSKTNDKYTWVSADGVYLVIQEGRIIQSQGLSNNLDENINSFKGWETEFKNKQYTSYSSFDEPVLRNLKILSIFNTVGLVKVDLQLQVLNLKLVEEKIIAPRVGWEKINKYWMDENNFVWKSNQNISPRLPKISYVITKKPR